ncbi:hypothetical protein M8J75_016588 [Diaphorina citri]|nr:hypothetical protein M8J75_016588 [Diaphorina citri]
MYYSILLLPLPSCTLYSTVHVVNALWIRIEDEEAASEEEDRPLLLKKKEKRKKKSRRSPPVYEDGIRW